LAPFSPIPIISYNLCSPNASTSTREGKNKHKGKCSEKTFKTSEKSQHKMSNVSRNTKAIKFAMANLACNKQGVRSLSILSATHPQELLHCHMGTALAVSCLSDTKMAMFYEESIKTQKQEPW
jgi:hypothetical protein